MEYVIVVVDKDLVLEQVRPELKIAMFDTLDKRITANYVLDGYFDPSDLYREAKSIAVISTKSYAQVSLGQSLEFLKDSGDLLLVAHKLELLGVSILNVGPTLPDESRAWPIVQMSLTFSECKIYFLDFMV